MIQEPAKLLELFGRHLVALCISVTDLGPNIKDSKERYLIFPGVLLCIEDIFFYLTAGHILSRIDDAISQNAIRIEKACLVDIWGSGRITDYPIPFDFHNAPHYYIVDDKLGLDFGIIILDEYYVRLIAANKVIAIFEKNWAKQHTVDYEFYFLLGFPVDFTSQELTGNGDLELSPILIPVQVMDHVPDDISQISSHRFYGKIDDDLPFSIEGMSGGPIFGFNTEREMRYWIVALQSAWYPQRKIIVGCTIPIIGNMITDLVHRARKESDESEDSGTNTKA